MSQDKKHYLLITSGWSKDDARVHYCLVHLEIIDDKIWIQYDGIEEGITSDLVRSGIPKEKIVLGFHPPEIRKHTEYAVM